MKPVERFRLLSLCLALALVVGGLYLLRALRRDVTESSHDDYIEHVAMQVEVSVEQKDVFAGELVDVRYRWLPLDDFERIPWNYRVRVRLEDEAGQLILVDDHFPPIPTSRWRKYPPQEYVRTLRFRESARSMNVNVFVGLFEKRRPYKKLELAGESRGDHLVRAGGFRVERTRRDIPEVHFIDGWYHPEKPPDSERVSRWMGEEAICQVGNLRRDVDLYLKGEIPREPFAKPSTITVLLNGEEVVSFRPPQGDFAKRIPIQSADLGENPSVLFTLHVDQTFTPSRSGIAEDPRILGLDLIDMAVLPRSAGALEVL